MGAVWQYSPQALPSYSWPWRPPPHLSTLPGGGGVVKTGLGSLSGHPECRSGEDDSGCVPDKTP